MTFWSFQNSISCWNFNKNLWIRIFVGYKLLYFGTQPTDLFDLLKNFFPLELNIILRIAVCIDFKRIFETVIQQNGDALINAAKHSNFYIYFQIKQSDET